MAVPETVSVFLVVQARLRSTRLPRKVFAPFPDVRYGPFLLDAVVARAERIGYPVTLTIPDTDLELGAYCQKREWPYTTGPEEDVLARYLLAARAFQADHIIRVTADCPFLDVEAARWTVEYHLRTGADFTHHLAEGRGVQVFTRQLLEESDRLAPSDKRHSPDLWVLANPGPYWIETMKFSVDTEEELELARKRAREEKE